MPLLRINATDQGLQLHQGSASISHAIKATRAHAGPAIIMVHGFKYVPGSVNHCPHTKIFQDGASGWPAALGLGQDTPNAGLGIAFGWYARGSLRQAHKRASGHGQYLAQLVRALRRSEPARPVHIIAHSLGAEIALSALAHLAPHDIRRMLILTGASFTSRANAMLTTPAGKTVDLFNITSRENDLFDLAFERFVPNPNACDSAMGQGLDLPNVTNLQLDCDQTLRVLDRIGQPVAAPQRRICHWSSYTRPGVMALYAKLLRDPAGLTRAQLDWLLPKAMEPRWSRLRCLPGPNAPKAIAEAAMRAFRIRSGQFPAPGPGRKSNEPA